jgi:hypothetical protein
MKYCLYIKRLKYGDTANCTLNAVGIVKVEIMNINGRLVVSSPALTYWYRSLKESRRRKFFPELLVPGRNYRVHRSTSVC